MDDELEYIYGQLHQAGELLDTGLVYEAHQIIDNILAREGEWDNA
jgi:hypothetical protein